MAANELLSAWLSGPAGLAGKKFELAIAVCDVYL